MIAVSLLLQGHKARAKQAARGRSIIALSIEAQKIRPQWDALTRWNVAAYLLGLISWREVEGLIR